MNGERYTHEGEENAEVVSAEITFTADQSPRALVVKETLGYRVYLEDAPPRDPPSWLGRPRVLQPTVVGTVQRPQVTTHSNQGLRKHGPETHNQ